ncbi:MAG: hypothetical protein ACTS10_21830 [Kiloniellales bacterium]
MSETPKMVIVPAEMTLHMAYRAYGAEPGSRAWAAAIIASPNAGKVRRADLERAMSAADHAYATSPGPTTELNRIWQDAFAAALGLEIAEEGDTDG